MFLLPGIMSVAPSGVSATQPYTTIVNSLNPVLYWKMDDAGSFVVDSTLNGRDATINGSYTRQDPSLLADGSGFSTGFTFGYVDYLVDAPLKLLTEFTFSCMFSIDSFLEEDQTLAVFGDNSTVTNYAWIARLDSFDNTINVIVTDGVYSFSEFTAPISDSDPHHLIVSFKNGYLAITLDGATSSYSTNLLYPIKHNQNNFCLGITQDSGFQNDPFMGNIDEVVYFDRELSSYEKSLLYTASLYT